LPRWVGSPPPPPPPPPHPLAPAPSSLCHSAHPSHTDSLFLPSVFRRSLSRVREFLFFEFAYPSSLICTPVSASLPSGIHLERFAVRGSSHFFLARFNHHSFNSLLSPFNHTKSLIFSCLPRLSDSPRLGSFSVIKCSTTARVFQVPSSFNGGVERYVALPPYLSYFHSNRGRADLKTVKRTKGRPPRSQLNHAEQVCVQCALGFTLKLTVGPHFECTC
jgi:hypothetical protein